MKVAADPQSGSAAGDGAEVEALIVTAQKREQDIQDVPIAISAFTQESLDAQKIEGGFDLLKAIPNVTFSKNNFSSYNFSIRGIGTKAISVATDPGVAVEFNDTPLLRNRLFEQEYFDLERVEVLRGPQGTLHGRNATAGVINVISAKANLDDFEGRIKGEVGNYHTKRLSGMINVPLVKDVLGLRFAGAMTDRAGYDYNSITKHAINGRDLWSGRLSLRYEPSERVRTDLIWERFNEDDDRSRTGKQLCHRDQGPTMVGGTTVPTIIDQAALSQGCRRGSLYDDAAFGTPNGLSMPHMLVAAGGTSGWQIYFGDNPGAFSIVNPVDPYGGMRQSADLREIASIFDPVYRAKADILEWNISYDISNSMTFTSQTAYNRDRYYSTQDFNRFNSYPVFRDTSGDYYNVWGVDPDGWPIVVGQQPTTWSAAVAGGIYCDPQLGCSDTIAGLDMSRARSSQFSQEFRVQSSFDGQFNFSAGTNYTRYRTVEDYFVFFNVLSAVSEALNWSGSQYPTPRPYEECIRGFFMFSGDDGRGCIYVDRNPLESFDGEGHNYFRSQNPYTLVSAAIFGEVYWKIDDALKLTAGIRYTNDRKKFVQIPSQLLLSSAPILAGTVDKGYPEVGEIKQRWGEFSGRLGIDWTPELSFTDQTLIYAFYSRGYKGGGANPPGIGFRTGPDLLVSTPGVPSTFDPEFVNAYEIGAKNTLLGGAMVLNLGAFYYDYVDYQVSKIVDRTAANENFDAKIWGLELESLFRPSENLRLNLNFGYQDTKIAGGERSIDVMNRLQGVEGYLVVKPFVQLPSNCVVPMEYVESLLLDTSWQPGTVSEFCPGIPTNLRHKYDLTALPNAGLVIYDVIGGNELPNAPHWTVSVGAEHSWDLFDGSWRATLRGDAYWQSQSWARVHNAVNDKLHGWYNTNLSLWIERPEDALKFEVYVKNALDGTPITDAFLNSDDTSLTTNVFMLDPRLIGLSVTKGF